jgi:hypothetical protein
MKLTIKFITILIILCQFAPTYSQLGINSTNTAPDSKAMLNISSTTKRVLIPGMTTAQRIAIAPAATQIGLTVFDTDTKSQWFYDSANWKEMAGGTGLVSPYTMEIMHWILQIQLVEQLIFKAPIV